MDSYKSYFTIWFTLWSSWIKNINVCTQGGSAFPKVCDPFLMPRWDVPQWRKAVCWSVCAIDLYKEWAGSCPVWARRPPGSANLETFQSHCREKERIFRLCKQTLNTDQKCSCLSFLSEFNHLLHEWSWVDLITAAQCQMSQGGKLLQDWETVCRHKHAITVMIKTHD